MLDLSSIVIAVGIAVLASLFSPEGKTKKWVNFVLGLVAFSALATPLLSLKTEEFPFPTFTEQQVVTDGAMDTVLSFGEEEIEKKIGEAFEISPLHIDVDMSRYDERVIVVSLGSPVDRKGLTRYLKTILGEDWEVILHGG